MTALLAPPAGALAYAARTHVGLVREHNEDFHGVYGRAAIVADGMGGHAAGEIAARLAADSIGVVMSELPEDASAETVRQAFHTGFAAAFHSCREHAALHPHTGRMGATVAAVWIGAGFAVTAHLGDARVYRLRGRRALITRDHSVVMDMVASGDLTREEARVHPLSGQVTACVGAHWDWEREPALATLDIQSGDRFLVLSDGISDMIPGTELCALAAEAATAEIAAEALERAALAAGGRDNATTIVLDVPAGSALGQQHVTPTPHC